MGALKNSLVGLRQDPRLLKVPSFPSLLCVVVGIAWLLILPLDEYSRHTYVSENALLPGQVSTYFGGSEHNVFRAYRHEVAELARDPVPDIARTLKGIFESQGLKTATQKYSHQVAGKNIAGENVYAILQGPRADATEALVLMAGWKNMDGVLNHSGVALVLALARYFKRWSLWSKDILFVITTDSIAGPQAWVDAYHSQHDPAHVEDLSIKGGALQGALALDYTAGTGGHRFDKLHLLYDGLNGQLPNLDLFNTITHIAKDNMRMGCTIQRMLGHTDSYRDRLMTILTGMLTQGLGAASGPHSSFIPYHVDAVTIQTVGDGWNDEMSLGRVIESTFRSLNNLLEHFHQSFFFYLLTEAQRFTSIGTYLPAAMLISASFSIAAITLWLHSGRRASERGNILAKPGQPAEEKQPMEVLEHDGDVALVPRELLQPSERKMLAPLSFLCALHMLGIVPLWLLNGASPSNTLLRFIFINIISGVAPVAAAITMKRFVAPADLHQAGTLLSAFSLLVLGVALSTLSTLNFSLGFIIALLASPLAFVNVFALPSDSNGRPTNKIWTVLWMGALLLLSPNSMIATLASLSQLIHQRAEAATTWLDGLTYAVTEASQAWHIGGTYTSLVVWLIWWPAWLTGTTMAVCSLLGYLCLPGDVPTADAGSPKDASKVPGREETSRFGPKA